MLFGRGDGAVLTRLWPGFDSRTWCHMLVEFFVGSLPCSEGFSPGPLVSSLYKNQHFEFQFNLETVDKKSQLVECPLLNDLIPLIIIVIVVIF